MPPCAPTARPYTPRMIPAKQACCISAASSWHVMRVRVLCLLADVGCALEVGLCLCLIVGAVGAFWWLSCTSRSRAFKICSPIFLSFFLACLLPFLVLLAQRNKKKWDCCTTARSLAGFSMARAGSRGHLRRRPTVAPRRSCGCSSSLDRPLPFLRTLQALPPVGLKQTWMRSTTS